jgi:lamin tail-like protein
MGRLVVAALALSACGGDGPAPLPAGALVVTEIMANPSQVPDADGEWFELYNSTPSVIDLNGLTVRDDGTDSFTVATSLVIGSGSYLALGRSSVSSNGGADVAYVYSGFTLDDDGDEIILFYRGVQVDRVAYHPGFPMVAGAAMNLQPGANQTGNDFASSWCAATTVYGAGDAGTPGAVNRNC